jgi:curved DNA-binding protein CbpA
LSRTNINPDYYRILGASEDDSPRQIERLYKRLAHLRHPDRGGSEDEMKTLNEAYRVLHDAGQRREYDSRRRKCPEPSANVEVASTARDVGVYGQLLSALLCILMGLMLLFLVRFNGLWFLWPLSILATGVVLFGVIIAHAAMTNARQLLSPTYRMLRFRAALEIAFWVVVGAGAYVVYLVLTTI